MFFPFIKLLRINLKVSLSDYAGKYVVVYFYPLDFTFVCPTEIIAFSDRIQEFKDIGCEVVYVDCRYFSATFLSAICKIIN